jgi:hypothetical protein
LPGDRCDQYCAASQRQRIDFAKKEASIKTEFPAHLEIPFASHLEILCWFRFWSKADEGRRALNVARLIKIRIERMNAVCALQASDRSR